MARSIATSLSGIRRQSMRGLRKPCYGKCLKRITAEPSRSRRRSSKNVFWDGSSERHNSQRARCIREAKQRRVASYAWLALAANPVGRQDSRVFFGASYFFAPTNGPITRLRIVVRPARQISGTCVQAKAWRLQLKFAVSGNAVVLHLYGLRRRIFYAVIRFAHPIRVPGGIAESTEVLSRNQIRG